MSQSNTQGTNNTTQDNGQNTEQRLVEALNTLSEKIKSDVANRKDKYIFGDIGKMGQEEIDRTMLQYRIAIAKCGYEVEVCENIDIKEVNNGTKFYIRIVGENGCYVNIDFFKYREICLDFNEDERTFIKGYIERMTGSIGEKEEEAVNLIVEYISWLSHMKDKQTKVYSDLGWTKYYGAPVFKYDVLYSNIGINGKCINGIKEALLSNVEYRDNAEYEEIVGEWVKQLNRVMRYSVTASLIIAAGISGIFRQMLPYTKETNINMNIVAERASGKSTISHFVLSFFGNPGVLEGSFTDTDNAMEMARAERTVIPYVLDERMLKIEGESENAKKRALILGIFREYEGKVKERVGKQFDDVSGKRTYSPIISSSVDSMLELIFDYADLGQFRRFIEINIEDKKTLFESSLEAEITEHMAYSSYGYGVQILMEYIFNNKLEDGEQINRLFDAENEKIKDKLKWIEDTNADISGIQACSQRFALIVVSYLILIRAIAYYFNGVNQEIDGQSEAITDMLIQNAVDKMKRVKQRVHVKDNIFAFIEKYNDLFCTDKNWDGTGEYLGQLEKTGDGYIIYLRKGSHIGWIMAMPLEYDRDSLINHVGKCIQKNYKRADKELLDSVIDLVGELPNKDFEEFLSKNAPEVRFGEKRLPNVRFDTITVVEKDLNADGKKDSEGEEE